jgi:hypothetical protein
MNIFVLDEDPIVAAQYHCDRHIGKMLLESVQILSAAHIVNDGAERARATIPAILNVVHTEHPCVTWTRESFENYKWVALLACKLVSEFNSRYGRPHKYTELAWQLMTPPMFLSRTEQSPFVQCMPPQYRQKDAVLAYRNYYRHEKRSFAAWHAPAKVPQWWLDMEEKGHAEA